MNPPYDFFDHDADIGIVGRGATLEAAFETAARAMFSIMAGPNNLGLVSRARGSISALPSGFPNRNQ